MKKDSLFQLGVLILCLALGVLAGRLSFGAGGAVIRLESGERLSPDRLTLADWAPPAVPVAETGRININLADEALLAELPGVGPVIAGRIVAYREKNGPFARTEDLLAVKGIGEKILERISGMITVS